MALEFMMSSVVGLRMLAMAVQTPDAYRVIVLMHRTHRFVSAEPLYLVN
jgi:hypothetical protein